MSYLKIIVRSGFLFIFLLVVGTNLWAEDSESILVFAAASTTNVMNEAAKDFEAISGIRVICSFAASSTLARQIAQGAPADIYLSANLKWMDYLESKHHIDATGKVNLFSNRLVLIAPKGKPAKWNINSTLPLHKMLGGGYLAIANPDHTPVGIYAKQSLRALGLWQGVENRIARTKDVRAALMLVERGESPLGIVYQTDAKISKKINIVGYFPTESHSPIVYLSAPVSSTVHKEKAGMFLNYLTSKKAGTIFKKHGFETETL